MSSHVVVLALAYAFVLFVLLLLLIRARLSLTLRLSVVLVASGFYLLHYFSLSELQGWPVDSPLPEEFTLHAWRIQESNPIEGQSGYVYLWVQTQDWDAPRAYALPYISTLHDRLETAEARRREGHLQEGRIDGSGTIQFSDTSRRLPAKQITPSVPKS